jgi:4-hydroxy-tetrahydrodipicolinate reductase
MIRVAVNGAAGRMGTHVLRAVERDSDTAIVSALEVPGHPRLGEEVAPDVRIGPDASAALSNADVAIDFSIPAGSMPLVAAAVERKVALVIGTTGFSPEQQGRLEEAARTVPIVMAANFSLGVNVMLEVVAELASRLRDYDAEIVELHHAAKVDAPSGTAIRLSDAIAEARGLDPTSARVTAREGHTGARPAESIGVQSLRAGDSVGEHTVLFAGPGERVEVSHRALSRDNFAAGAVRAARWIVGQPPGLYSMRNVLSTSRAPAPDSTGAA